MSKVLLSDIKELHFFEHVPTKSRRTSPIPQLTCQGKICRKYHPSSVSCTNIGGDGNDVTWKCTADLPSSLRFGTVDVSCEGWRKPGDSFVLEGSCGLTYSLVKIHDSLDHDYTSTRARNFSWHRSWHSSDSVSSLFFSLAFIAVFAFILYNFVKSCFGRRERGVASGVPRITGPQGPDGSTPGAWFGGNNDNNNDNNNGAPPPPPYSAHPKPDPNATGTGWRPGFWTGMGLGYLGTWLTSRNRNRPPVAPYGDWRQGRAYDWEGNSRGFRTRFESPNEGIWSNVRSRNVDRGEGGSNLGSMRSSSGLARSNVR